MEDYEEEEDQEVEDLAVGNRAESSLTMMHPLSAGVRSLPLSTREEEVTSEQVFLSHCQGAEGRKVGGGDEESCYVKLVR